MDVPEIHHLLDNLNLSEEEYNRNGGANSFRHPWRGKTWRANLMPLVPCLKCAGCAVRISEGQENDCYRFSSCGYEFLIDWSYNGPLQKP